jgi:hypothetical protein
MREAKEKHDPLIDRERAEFQSRLYPDVRYLHVRGDVITDKDAERGDWSHHKKRVVFISPAVSMSNGVRNELSMPGLMPDWLKQLRIDRMAKKLSETSS